MNPEATLIELESCIKARDYAAAVTFLNTYYRWRLRGGFEPTHGDARANDLADILADRMTEK